MLHKSYSKQKIEGSSTIASQESFVGSIQRSFRDKKSEIFFFLIHDHIIGYVIDPFRAWKLVIILANISARYQSSSSQYARILRERVLPRYQPDWFLDTLQYNRFLDYLESDPFFFPPLYRSRWPSPTNQRNNNNNNIIRSLDAISTDFSNENSPQISKFPIFIFLARYSLSSPIKFLSLPLCSIHNIDFSFSLSSKNIFQITCRNTYRLFSFGLIHSHAINPSGNADRIHGYRI